MDRPLDIIVQLPSEPIYRGAPCPIEITIVNQTVEPVMINRRLAIGYSNCLARELYIELRDAKTGSDVSIMEVDYQRDFSPSSDYGYLAPGEKVSITFDLFEWYEPVNPGTYVLVVHYQADEPLAEPPLEILRGVHSSKPMELSIMPGKADQK
jgi:hypothetical protein